MRNLFKIVLTIGLCLGNYGCYYDQEAVKEAIPDQNPDTPISFKTDIEPLFSRSNTNCTQCHNGLLQNPDLRIGNAYDALIGGGYIANNAESSLFYQKLPGNGHAISVGFVLSTDDISLIKAWIDRGAENN